jgi:hypothetical protein
MSEKTEFSGCKFYLKLEIRRGIYLETNPSPQKYTIYSNPI